MKVRELIKQLKPLPPQSEVYVMGAKYDGTVEYICILDHETRSPPDVFIWSVKIKKPVIIVRSENEK